MSVGVSRGVADGPTRSAHTRMGGEHSWRDGGVRCLLPSGGLQILDLVLFHFGVEGRTVEPENGSGLLLVPVRTLQRLQDRHPLDLRQRAVRWNDEFGAWAALLPDGLRQIADGDL